MELGARRPRRRGSLTKQSSRQTQQGRHRTLTHYPMLQRNLLYTAVTRGKRLVVIVGQKKAMAIAVKGKQRRRRVVEAQGALAVRSLGAGQDDRAVPA